MLRYYVRSTEFLGKFAANAKGVTAIEYALIAVLIAVVIVVAVGLLGGEVTGLFEQVETGLADR